MAVLGIGWDVGGWIGRGQGVAVVDWHGQSPRWRGWKSFSLRKLEINWTVDDLVRCAWPEAPTDVLEHHEVVLAIDAPLGFPIAFRDLLTGDSLQRIDPKRDEIDNPLAYRETDRHIHRTFNKKKPLSASFDRLGNNATLAMVQTRRLSAKGQIGVLPFDEPEPGIPTAIEVYPALMKKNATVRALLPETPPMDKHEFDACLCALLALAYGYNGRITSLPRLQGPRKSNGGYIPGDIKSGAGEEGAEEDSKKPKLHYAVQLGLYVDVLEQLGLSAGRQGFIWDVHGAEVAYDFTLPLGRKNSRTLWDEYQAALTEARAILSQSLKPQGAYSAACKLCHWYSYSLKQLQDADDLTLIPYLGRSKRDRLQSRFSTIAELASADIEAFMRGKKPTKTIFKGMSANTLRTFHARAKLLKQPSPKPYLKAPISLPVHPRELFFDVEFDPMRDVCYLHGFIERIEGRDSTEKYVAFFADEPTEKCEREAFVQAIAYMRHPQPATVFYYSKYERAIYRKLQQRFPDVCSADEVEELFRPANAVDLYFDVVLTKVEFPTRDYSIKTLAQFLGFKWRDTDPSGAASIEWFNRWIEARQPDVKQRILDYNEDDCRATRVLLDGIRALSYTKSLSV